MLRIPAVCRRRTVLPARAGGQRLDIALPPADIDAVRTVAAITGETTLTAVVRHALKVYVWLVTEQQRRRQIFSIDPEGGDRIQLMPLVRVTGLADNADRRMKNEE